MAKEWGKHSHSEQLPVRDDACGPLLCRAHAQRILQEYAIANPDVPAGDAAYHYRKFGVVEGRPLPVCSCGALRSLRNRSSRPGSSSTPNFT